MRRSLALLCTAAIVGGAAAVAASAPSTLKLVTVQTSSKQSPKGFTGTENVLQNGKKVGTDKITCVFAGGKCKVALTLSSGVINLTFVTSANATGGPLKVVGGTGSYQGATGTGSYKQLNKNGSRTAVTLNLK